jgi:hypothetical protein
MRENYRRFQGGRGLEPHPMDDKPFPGNGDEADRAENGRILLDVLSA